MNDPADVLTRWATRLRFAEIVRNEAKRTVVCSIADAPVLTAAVHLLNGDDVLTIQGSAYVPEVTAYVIDAQAIEAETTASLTRWPFTP